MDLKKVRWIEEKNGRNKYIGRELLEAVVLENGQRGDSEWSV